MGRSWAVGSNVFVSGKIRTLDGGRALNSFFFLLLLAVEG